MGFIRSHKPSDKNGVGSILNGIDTDDVDTATPQGKWDVWKTMRAQKVNGYLAVSVLMVMSHETPATPKGWSFKRWNTLGYPYG